MSTSTTLAPGSTLGVLARQEIRNYLRHKLFWFGAALSVAVAVVMLVADDPTSSAGYMIAPAALLGVLGLVVMVGLTRRSDRAAESAGAVVLPERTRTLALAAAVVVPAGLAFAVWVVAAVVWFVKPAADYVVPPGIGDGFVLAAMFGAGVMCAVGGPILGLLLARYVHTRGTAAIAAVLLVLVTILLQGNFTGGQPYRVFWVWTYFLGQLGWGPDAAGEIHFRTAPGNPFTWVLYLAVLCAVGLVLALLHDPEAERDGLRRVAAGLVVAALVLGVVTMTLGWTDVVVDPLPCTTC
ncbi:hypothetical protein [Phycicoccus avicenniae]|uniref:hypothetical protein n=1 Tax=Phycicoccus avicenniae TaxID=2828860 RepID=UPI003D2ADED5